MLIGVVADLWSKSAVFNWLSKVPGNEKVFIEGFFSFVLRVNDGAAFSILAGKQTFLVGVSVVALIAVICIFFFGKITSRVYVVSMALFLAGIVGNLYDRATTGLVRDFIDVHWKEVYHWPAFNIADSMLCTAVGLMIIMQMKSTSSQKSDDPHKQEQ